MFQPFFQRHAMLNGWVRLSIEQYFSVLLVEARLEGCSIHSENTSAAA